MTPMSNAALATSNPAASQSTGGRLVTADGRTLPLRGTEVSAAAKGGVARVVLVQTFENVYDEPLHVTYLMPLPADGAVSGYAFLLGDRRITGEVDRKQRARQRFEQALSEGRSAGLVEQERSSLFTQELGNIPPRSIVTAEIIVDQKLAWLSDGAWEWRFPTAIGPRYQGAAGRVSDAAKIEVAVADAPLPVRVHFALTVADALQSDGRPTSPSHALHIVTGANQTHIELAAEAGARLDRDLVVRWPVATKRPGVSLFAAKPAQPTALAGRAFGLLSLVPPAPAAMRAVSRDLILLFDTSGSMGGQPLEQSRRIALAMIDSLGAHDRLEMIEFSNSARRWQKKPVNADDKQKSAARDWVKRLAASGGTEMVSGVMEALAPIGPESQRQVILLTDGYIGFETEVVKAVCDKLPSGSRLHVVGVGSAINRSLTQPTARAGRGLELVIGIDEDPERAAKRLVAATAEPIVTNVTLEGTALVKHAPLRLPDLYAGSPALCAVELLPSGGTLVVRGRTADGEWQSVIETGALEQAPAQHPAAALFAREAVEDLELARAAGGDHATIDRQIETLGVDHQIATRLTTWIAVSKEITVDPTAPTRREEVPQELPHGVSAEGLGLRATSAVGFGAAAPATAGMPVMPAPMSPAPMAPGRARAGGAPPPPPAAQGAPKAKSGGILSRAIDALKELTSSSDRGAPANEPSESAKADDADESFSADETTQAGGGGAEKKVMAPPSKAAKADDDADQAFGVKRRVVHVVDEEPEEREESRSMTRAGRVTIMRLRGKIRLRANGQLVIEIVLDKQLPWMPQATATVKLLDGSSKEIAVVMERTTAAGAYNPGQTVRLVLATEQDTIREVSFFAYVIEVAE